MVHLNVILLIIICSFLFFRDMDGFGITLAIGALKAIAFVCDILTFPIYVLLQKPWKVRALSRRVKVS